jgi:hypothetical protein
MDILRKARRLESRLARTFDRAAEHWSQSGPRGPLEILHAIVDRVEEALEPAGRGTRVFPFNRMKVSVLADTRQARSRFAALFHAEPKLEERVRTRLQQAGCDAPNLQVKVSYVDRAAPDWTTPDLHVEFDRVASADTPAERSSPAETIRLAVIQGAAGKPSYAFTLDRINIGRCGEIRDSQNRLIRTNHVAFAEGAVEAASTVSRRHAHIEYSREQRHYRISDDGSAYGTAIVRNGKTIAVPSGPRGVRLRSGDELLFGEARLRVRIENG